MERPSPAAPASPIRTKQFGQSARKKKHLESTSTAATHNDDSPCSPTRTTTPPPPLQLHQQPQFTAVLQEGCDFGSATSAAGTAGSDSAAVREILQDLMNTSTVLEGLEDDNEAINNYTGDSTAMNIVGLAQEAGEGSQQNTPSQSPAKARKQSSPPQQQNPSRVNYSLEYDDDSVLLWSDDPEKQYFAYMLQQEQEQRALRGKSEEDSLIGNSTLEDIQLHSSQWEQHGGGQDADVVVDLEDDNNSFPVLSSAHNSSHPPAPSTVDGYSLATTEKSDGQLPQPLSLSSLSRPKNNKSRVTSPYELEPYHKTNKKTNDYDDHDDRKTTSSSSPTTKLFPEFIILSDAASAGPHKPSTPDTVTSQQDFSSSSRNKFRRRCFFATAALLCCISISAAIVAIYFSLFDDNESSSRNSSSNSVYETEDGEVIILPGTSNPITTPTNAASTKEPTITTIPNEDNDNSGTTTPKEKPTFRPTSKPNPVIPATTGTSTIQPTQAPTTETPTQQSGDDDEIIDIPIFTNPNTRCGCPECTGNAVLQQMADQVTCEARIDFLVQQWQYSEEEACRRVAGFEFPVACSSQLCNPDECLANSIAAPTTVDNAINEEEQQQPPMTSPTPKTYTPAPTSLRPTRLPTTSSPTPVPTTSHPTLRPTPRPSSKDLDLVGNDGRPQNAYPLGRCEGDCDDDDDCDVGLVCFQRSRGDAVPGCDEGESETSQTDFCVPEGATLPPTTLGPTTLPPTRRPTVRSTDDDINGRDDELSSAPTFSPTISPTKSNEGSFIGDAMCNTLGLFC